MGTSEDGMMRGNELARFAEEFAATRDAMPDSGWTVAWALTACGDGFELGESFMRSAHGEAGGTAVLWFTVNDDGTVNVRLPRASMSSVRAGSDSPGMPVASLDLHDGPDHILRRR